MPDKNDDCVNSSIVHTEEQPPAPLSDFSPVDQSDLREPGDYKSKYGSRDAQRGILLEAAYLMALLVAVPVLMLILWTELPKDYLHISAGKYPSILKYALAWLGGTLGGTLFGIKWLYHSVAKQKWHFDRRLWRVFTPFLSGALAFAVMTLISSGLLSIFDLRAVQSCSLVVGISFLVGYFSDSAIAKLTEMAETLFGPSHRGEKQPTGNVVKGESKNAN